MFIMKILEMIRKQEEDQVITVDLSNFIELITRGQTASVLRSDMHNGRLTSSNFGKVVHNRQYQHN